MEGASSVSNNENSGVITAVFPKTAAATYTIEADKAGITFDSLTEGYETAPTAQTVKITNKGNLEVKRCV